MTTSSAPTPGDTSVMSAPGRLAAVAGLRLTGHLGDPHLDAAVRTLSLACSVPIAVVNVATPGLQTYPAEVGVGAACTQVPDALSPCAEVVESGRPLHVHDLGAHPAYATNPLVEGGHIRAYAGEPLLHQGHVVGVLSVFDPEPRVFGAEDLEVLGHQARLVEAILALRAASAWDTLTGLPDRALLVDRLDRSVARAADRGELVGVAVVDVRGTEEINLRYGSGAGDAVLHAVAARLSHAVGRGDSVARLAGDEFAVVLEDLASLEDARARAAQLVESARGAVIVEDDEIEVELSCGVATTPAADAEALLAAAEHARARTDGTRTASARAAEAALREAVLDDQLVLHYQPVVSLDTGEVRGVEALVRWQHPERGLLPPSEFISLAEDSGLVLPMGAALLRKAAEQISAWQAAGRDLTVSVNLSPRQMADASFERTVADVLALTGAPADRLVLEITESSLMDHPSALRTLTALRALGVHLALDDFGTGYSSLAYLRRFPVDTIKVDRSFVSGLGRHADDDAIVASVVSLAANVDKVVVAEGVENEQQAEALRRLGVPLAQGFLWSRALPVDELERWLDAPRTAPAPRLAEVRLPAQRRTAVDGAEVRIWRMHRDGASLHTIAAALNAEGCRTDRGLRWHARSVASVLTSTRVSA